MTLPDVIRHRWTLRLFSDAKKLRSVWAHLQYLCGSDHPDNVVGGLLYSRRAHALTDKDWILLTDFTNTTGDTVFDGTLKQALAVQLQQSPFLNVYPEQRVRQALKFAGKSEDERVTVPVARDLCQREGVKAIMTGSISAIGSSYVVSLEALNCVTGDPIARQQ
jgi:eukaryotic-like serine/threonine-protein kinase